MSVDVDYPEVLIVEPGQSIEGRFERLERGHTKNGEDRAIAILTVGEVERSLWLHETALRGQFAEKKPEAGERLTITKGAAKRESAGGAWYWPFKVATPDRPVEVVGWDSPLLATGDDRGEATVGSDIPSDLGDFAAATSDDEPLPF